MSNDFRTELARLINAHSKENGSNTPDWILAEYLENCLDNFDRTITARAQWYGRMDEPGQNSVPLIRPEDDPSLEDDTRLFYETQIAPEAERNGGKAEKWDELPKQRKEWFREFLRKNTATRGLIPHETLPEKASDMQGIHRARRNLAHAWNGEDLE